MSKKRSVREDLLNVEEQLKWENIEDCTALVLFILWLCFVVYVVIAFSGFK